MTSVPSDASTLHASDRQLLTFIIHEHGFTADWETAEAPLDHRQSQLQNELYAAFYAQPDQALFGLAFRDGADLLTQSSRYLAQIARSFVEQLALRPEREFLREKLVIELSPDTIAGLLDQAPFMYGGEHLSSTWLFGIWQRLQHVYSTEIIKFSGTVEAYLIARHAQVKPVGRIFFHLVENKRADLPFAFLATYADGVDSAGKARHLPLKNAVLEYQGNSQKMLALLSTVHRAADQSSFVREILDSGEIFQPIGLTAHEAYLFLREIEIYEAAGILCRIPDWWKKKTRSARIEIKIGSRMPSRVGLDALVDFQVVLNLGDLEMTLEELQKLLAETEGLALIKGRWVEVDHQKLKAALSAYEHLQKKLKGEALSFLEAMTLQLRPETVLAESGAAVEIEISQGQWLQTLLQKLANADFPGQPSTGAPFYATLRPYQEKGLSWLSQMKAWKLGACLADDMGLGKTVQVIALLNSVRESECEKSLLVVPASLIGNWKAEIERFAPELRLLILHPSETRTKVQPSDQETWLIDDYDVVLTTYGMLERYAELQERPWDTLILDEAQAIKNPATRQTRAAKKISADFRVALTGTPIENRLSDLWSLFDFLNRGLLGSAKEFSSYVQRLSAQQADYSHLRQAISPFILRRLKTDRSVIDDLPEKIEMKTYTTLSKKQQVLYRKAVDELKLKLEATGQGVERKGLILASIMKFKQICNHPDQFLGQSAFLEQDGGKFAQLRELCETIYEKRERVLVFTQFREMVEPLARFLASIFAHEGLTLHGGTAVKQRKQIVERFQGEAYVPFLVLSIKAGGVGLNLTAASHVIHFDRWWNPAVENQATDRAFRIGQKNRVVVHKLITSGTIEEKIDRMIEDKVALAREIIPESQETWLTEMNNQQLLELFRLSD